MLELFGDKVIPEFDKDPVHSTTATGEAADPKSPSSATRSPTSTSRSSRRRPCRWPLDQADVTTRGRRSQPAPPSSAAATHAPLRIPDPRPTPRRGPAPVRRPRRLPGDLPRDHRGRRAAQHLGAHLPLRQPLRRLAEILRHHNDPLDAGRAELAPEPLGGRSTRQLVTALVCRTPAPRRREGRNYLRIVPQLVGTFAAWQGQTELSPPQLRRILATLAERVEAEGPVRRERILHLIMLMTQSTGERARRSRRTASPRSTTRRSWPASPTRPLPPSTPPSAARPRVTPRGGARRGYGGRVARTPPGPAERGPHRRPPRRPGDGRFRRRAGPDQRRRERSPGSCGASRPRRATPPPCGRTRTTGCW